MSSTEVSTATLLDFKQGGPFEKLLMSEVLWYDGILEGFVKLAVV
ncbi:MAG TPA: hypothetical protein VK568_00990 [Thermodesulfobacteriota bacterium]|jgi:hypothetical protein|nr:hypothetical protein [Thermodesulfobacteriota bacterium]